MPAYPPPERAPNRARTEVLPAGTALYRVHSTRFSPTQFNDTAPGSGMSPGGRFDSPDGSPAFLYAALSVDTAVAESLFRGVNFALDGRRILERARVKDRCLSTLTTLEPLRVVALHGSGLARLGQDTWLVHSAPGDYSVTQQWGRSIMRWNPSAAGLLWHPRHDDDGLALCLYQDRLAASALAHEDMVRLDTPGGIGAITSSLRRFGVLLPLSP